MIKVPVHNMAGELIEELEVDEARLGGEVRPDVLRQAVLSYEANQRAGTAKTKDRSEVAYADNKPWPQKHTGRARAGTPASPVWVGGGVAFGPRPRDYSKKMNRKMRSRALASALLAKLLDGEVKVLDALELSEGKTSEMAGVLKNLGVDRTFLILLPQQDAQLWRCTRNIPGAGMKAVREANAYEIVRPRHVIFTREAFEQMLESLGQKTAGAADTTESG